MQCNVMQGYVNTFFAPNITMWVFVFFCADRLLLLPPSSLVFSLLFISTLSVNLSLPTFSILTSVFQLLSINFPLSISLYPTFCLSSLSTHLFQLSAINSAPLTPLSGVVFLLSKMNMVLKNCPTQFNILDDLSDIVSTLECVY